MGEPLRWSDSFAVGHEAIDKGHRTLVQLINEISAAAANGHEVASLLKTLGGAVEDHLRTENSVLWELRGRTYEGMKHSAAAKRVVAGMATNVFDTHMAEHAALLGHFEEIKQTPLETLGDALKFWFINHAIKQDLHLKTIFQAMQ